MGPPLRGLPTPQPITDVREAELLETPVSQVAQCGEGQSPRVTPDGQAAGVLEELP